MKKLSFLFILFIVRGGFSFAQTTITEQYFHELKGMEDTAGVTHLFYREYERSTFQCSEGNGGHTVYSGSNDVFHFNVQANTDSVKFDDGFSEWCLDGMSDSKYIISYVIFKNNHEKWIANISYGDTFEISDYLGNSLSFQIPIPIKTTNQNNLLSYLPDKILLSTNNDTLYVITSSDITIPFPGDGDDWPQFESFKAFQSYADSLAFSKELLGIHPAIDSLYFSINGAGALYRSEHYSHDFVVADSAHYFRNIYFDADTTHLYSFNPTGLLRSDNLGKQDSWTSIDLNFATKAPRFHALDNSLSGNLFISDSTVILYSDNYGDSFSALISVDDEIAGLYKKPDSNLLYVLTKKELLQLNTDTKEISTLKKLAVSNETESSHVPKQITLAQNYPNPFNPSTVISYQLNSNQLNSNQLVRLEVFDVTGRKVAVLVDGELQSVGAHRVSFDGSGLASGMYFYRLQAGGQTLLKAMNFIK